MRQLATTGVADIAAVNDLEVVAATLPYQRANHVYAKVTREGADVRVEAWTDEKLGEGAKRIHQEDEHGFAHARARLELFAIPGAGIAGNVGPEVTGGDPTISDKEWKKLGKEISDPPTCGTGASSNDLVTLGHLLQQHGFNVGRERRDGRPARADGARPGRLALQVPRLRRAGRQPRPGRREGRDRRARLAPARPRLPHDLAGRGPLRSHPHRRGQLPRHRPRLRAGRLGGRAGGDHAGGQARRLGRAGAAVHGLRRRSGRVLRRAAGHEGGGDHLRRARRVPRVPEGAPVGVRDGDRGVGRAQPEGHVRPRFARRLPAAGGLGLGGAAHGPALRGAGLCARGRVRRTRRG